MNQMYAEAGGEDMRSYTSLMSQNHLHTLTESIAASTNIYQIFNSFHCATNPNISLWQHYFGKTACLKKKKQKTKKKTPAWWEQNTAENSAPVTGQNSRSRPRVIGPNTFACRNWLKRWKEGRGLSFSGQHASRAAYTSKIDGSTRKLARIS